MKVSKVAKIIAACLIAFFAVGAFVACGSQPPVTPLESDVKIVSVSILDQNGNGVSSGYIAMDISAGTYQLDADVITTGDDFDKPVEFTSSDNDIATVAESGLVTLRASGEVVITASIGDKTSSVVLVIGNMAENRYTVTVENGTAQVDGADEYLAATTAVKDAVIALKADIPEGDEFVRWEIKNEQGVLINEYLDFNGQNIFYMPAMNVSVTAIYE